MRRVIQAFSVVLALAIVLGAAIPAWAADEVAGQEQVDLPIIPVSTIV